MGLRYLGQNTELYTIGQSNKWIGGGSILLASLWIYSYASCRRVLLLELTRAVLSVFFFKLPLKLIPCHWWYCIETDTILKSEGKWPHSMEATDRVCWFSNDQGGRWQTILFWHDKCWMFWTIIYHTESEFLFLFVIHKPSEVWFSIKKQELPKWLDV